jgi:molybdopterin molybdotransferase
MAAMAAELITVQQARARVLAAVRPLPLQSVDVSDALDRVLARDLRAAGDVPPFPCSGMDGFAVGAGPADRTLMVVGESRAGRPAERSLGDAEAIRISTGAAIPAGADAVIRQEDTEADGGTIRTRAEVVPGENVRFAGEDLRAAETVLARGRRLGIAELGAAVAAGHGWVEVARRPSVSVLCTGDELRAPGEPLGPGEIHNSNAPMLSALAARAGATVVEVARLRDDRASTERALAGALELADVIVISGGVSVGPHDHVKPALAALAVPESFWGVALQPGKPTWFGARDQQLVFGLPGNPVSAVVTFALFASPALGALQGEPQPDTASSGSAELATSVRRNARREQALRVRLEQRSGRTVAIPNGPQGSHLVSSLLGADALAMIPPGPGSLEAGAAVALSPLPR